MLARAGLRPLVVEQGQPAPQRAAVVRAFFEGGALDLFSNIQFGEGGAGTFSDGKLNTGTKSPHIRHVLETFVEAGAPEDILWQAKPHIGTDYLVDVVVRLRQMIEEAGGEVRFSTRLEGYSLDGEGHMAEAVLASAAAASPSGWKRAIWCWPVATPPATCSRCCKSAGCPWSASRFRWGPASSIRKHG